MGTKYDWAGTQIEFYPVATTKRRLCPPGSASPPIDTRDFITAPRRPEIYEAFINSGVPLPTLEKFPNSFDERVRRCWDFMLKWITYTRDGNRDIMTGADFWQFPTETLTRRVGDCEDMSMLLASLIIYSGISPYCVRVIRGDFRRHDLSKEETGREAHAWVVYKNESGLWCLIDPTWHSHMFDAGIWYPGDGCDDGIQDRADANVKYQYWPTKGFNCEHVWSIGEV